MNEGFVLQTEMGALRTSSEAVSLRNIQISYRASWWCEEKLCRSWEEARRSPGSSWFLSRDLTGTRSLTSSSSPEARLCRLTCDVTAGPVWLFRSERHPFAPTPRPIRGGLPRLPGRSRPFN